MNKRLTTAAATLCLAASLSAQVKVDYSNNTTAASDRQTGFFVPNDGYLSIGYNQQTHRLQHANGYNRDDYTLHGFELTGGPRAPLTMNGIVGIDVPISMRFDWNSDSHKYGYKKVEHMEGGVQMGIMACTGYRFAKDCYITLSIGPKIDLTCMDMYTRKPESGKSKTIDYVSDKDYKYTSMFDFPLSGQIAFRYHRLGIYIMGDYGTMNRKRSKFYEDTGLSKDYKVKSNRLNMGLQVYF